MEGIKILLCLWFIFIGLCSAQILSNTSDTDFTARKRRQSDFKCTLPPQLENGRWIITEADVSPGDTVNVNTVLRLECEEGYQLYPNIPLIICDSEWDSLSFPTCKKKCPAFYSTLTTKMSCKDREENSVSCDKATDGTYLTYSCIAYYEIPPGAKNALYCTDGTWDFPRPICQPVCGKKFNNETTALTWGGVEVKDIEYPWVIALFKNIGGRYENVCGGTLISRRVVITAAHCVTDTYGNALTRENFQVAAGKYYNAFGDQRDTTAQYKKISKVIVHGGYRGASQRFIADVALLVTQELFQIGPAVQPACIDNINNIYLTHSQIGEVAGWGLTEDEKAADRLRVIRIPYKEGSTCARELPESWEQQYNFLDKICAGRQNQSIAVCQGDSGSGLVFRNREDNRYYVHGIVSIAPSLHTAKCNFQTNALYTSVPFYYSFINKEMIRYYLEDCVLPKHPKNGRWHIDSDVQKNPGDVVTSNTILTFSCNRGFVLSTNLYFQQCEKSYNPPTCLILCPKLSLPGGTHLLCKNSRDQLIQCSEVADGSSIIFTCPPGFVTDRGTQTSTRYCRNGSYGSSAPSCISKDLYKKPKPTVPSIPTPATTLSTISVTPSNTPSVTEPASPGKGISNDGIKVICTYTSWKAYKGIYPEDFDATLCTHIVYQFVGLNDNGELRVGDESLDLKFYGQGLYKMTTDLKNSNKDLKVLLSIGGYGATNTTLFRGLANDETKIKAFLSSAEKIIKEYNFDGLDFYWFYPEQVDKKIYIHLLDSIKKNFDKHGWLLSATVKPGLEDTGYDPKEMDRIVDWVTLKTFDFYGGWNTYTGNHNQLYPSSKEYSWEKDHSNIDATAKNWMKAGLSKQKIVVSAAFFGATFTLKDKNHHGVHAPITGSGPERELTYYEICSDYKDGFQEVWDDETKTPYKYNDTLWIGYNNKDAAWIKGEYVKKNGYAGINVFPVDGDDNKGLCGEKHILLKHVHGGMGHNVKWDKDKKADCQAKLISNAYYICA